MLGTGKTDYRALKSQVRRPRLTALTARRGQPDVERSGCAARRARAGLEERGARPPAPGTAPGSGAFHAVMNDGPSAWRTSAQTLPPNPAPNADAAARARARGRSRASATVSGTWLPSQRSAASCDWSTSAPNRVEIAGGQRVARRRDDPSALEQELVEALQQHLLAEPVGRPAADSARRIAIGGVRRRSSPPPRASASRRPAGRAPPSSTAAADRDARL